MSTAERIRQQARAVLAILGGIVGPVLSRLRGRVKPAKALIEAIPGLPTGLKREQPLIPVDSSSSRALVAVIAILTFLAALAGGAAHLVARASVDWRGAVSNEMTIQVRPDVRRNIEADLARAAAIARQASGIREVRVAPRAESDRLLEPWLGTGLQISELPIPRLVILTIQPGSRPDVEALRQALRRDVPGASLDDHRLWVGRLSAMANTMIIAGIAVVLLISIAAGLAVAFATRGAMAGSHDSVEVLHLVGADDDFIAREFQGRFLKLGLEGGAIGGLLALATTALLGWLSLSLTAGPGADQLAALFGAFEMGWRGYLIVAGIAMMVALIAGLVSRFTVRRQLRLIA